MSTVNNITKALNGQKLELSSQVVELGIKQDADKSYKDAIAKRKAVFEAMESLKSEINKRKAIVEDAIKDSSNGIAILDRYELAIKDLGLEVPAELKQQRANLKDGISGTLTINKKKLDSF
jgi:hypothetical protein